MMQRYSTFEEIDERLKILRLQKEIHIEGLKYNLHRAKSDLYPKLLMDGLGGSLKQFALAYAIQRLSRLFRKQDRPKQIY